MDYTGLLGWISSQETELIQGREKERLEAVRKEGVYEGALKALSATRAQIKVLQERSEGKEKSDKTSPKGEKK